MKRIQKQRLEAFAAQGLTLHQSQQLRTLGGDDDDDDPGPGPPPPEGPMPPPPDFSS